MAGRAEGSITVHMWGDVGGCHQRGDRAAGVARAARARSRQGEGWAAGLRGGADGPAAAPGAAALRQCGGAKRPPQMDTPPASPADRSRWWWPVPRATYRRRAAASEQLPCAPLLREN